MNFPEIAKKFGIDDVFSVDELKTGHINRTYLINRKYILQSLNRDIFHEPEIIMHNIELIERAYAEYNHKPVYTKIPHYLKCNGRNYIEQDGVIWRMCDYIESCEPPSPPMFCIGFAVGHFLRVVNSADIEFRSAVNLHRFQLDLPMRNIHGDTKCDNIILGEKPAMIDFDTAMRGYICSDYGDMVRSVTSEDFDLQVIQEVTQGFADGIHGLLTDNEIFSLDSGIAMIISELIGRYHEGNKNFPNKTSGQCIERENQLRIQINKFFKHRRTIKEIIKRCFFR